MKFKIGNKVIVVKAVEPFQVSMKRFVGLKGVVFAICEEFSCTIYVRFNNPPIKSWGDTAAFKEEELKIYNEVGEQLMFAFMSD